MNRLLHELSFHFFAVNSQEHNDCVIDTVTSCLVLKDIVKLTFTEAVPFHSPARNI